MQPNLLKEKIYNVVYKLSAEKGKGFYGLEAVAEIVGVPADSEFKDALIALRKDGKLITVGSYLEPESVGLDNSVKIIDED